MQSMVLLETEDVNIHRESFFNFALLTKKNKFVCYIRIIKLWEAGIAVSMVGINPILTYFILYNGIAYKQMGSSGSILIDRFDDEMNQAKAMICFGEILKEKFLPDLKYPVLNDLRQLSKYLFKLQKRTFMINEMMDS